MRSSMIEREKGGEKKKSSIDPRMSNRVNTYFTSIPTLPFLHFLLDLIRNYRPQLDYQGMPTLLLVKAMS